MEWQSIWIVGASAGVIFILLPKSRRWRIKIWHLGITPWAPPHAYANRRWGNPVRMQHNPVLGCSIMLMMTSGLMERLGISGQYLECWLTDRAGEVVEALSDRKADIACIQETWWKGSCCKFFGAKGKRYKLFWMGGEERSDCVGIFIAEKWVDSVVNVERHSKKVLILKMVLYNG